MPRNQCFSTVVVAVLALVTIVIAACDSKGANSTPAGQNAIMPRSRYAAIAIGKVDVEGGIVEVAARRFGVASQVLAKEGDIVKKGQILARQEDEETRLAIDSARAAVIQAQSQLEMNQIAIKTAEREYARLGKLASTNAIAQQQLDQAGDSVAIAQAQFNAQKAAIQTALAQLAQAQYNEELTNVRAPMDGKIIRRYANPGSGASTLNVTSMFDLEPAIPHIIRAEISDGSVQDVQVGQEAEVTSETHSGKVFVGRVIRIAATFGARKNKSDGGNEATDERVVEVVVTADGMPFLIGQPVLVRFMNPGEKAGVAGGDAE